jgi:hypothetical protein
LIHTPSIRRPVSASATAPPAAPTTVPWAPRPAAARTWPRPRRAVA